MICHLMMLITCGHLNFKHQRFRVFLLARPQPTFQERLRKNIECLDSCFLNQSRVFLIPFGGVGDFNADTLDLLKDFGCSAVLYSNDRLNGGLENLKNTSSPLMYGN